MTTEQIAREAAEKICNSSTFQPLYPSGASRDEANRIITRAIERATESANKAADILLVKRDQLREQIAAPVEENAVLKSQVENADTNLEQVRMIERARVAALVAERDNLRTILKGECADEEEIRNLAEPIVGEHKAKHDGYAVVPIVNVVENIISQLRQRIEQMEMALREIAFNSEISSMQSNPKKNPQHIARVALAQEQP